MVEGEGFEPSKLSQQIYSLPPLTARESHRKKSETIPFFLKHRQVYFVENFIRRYFYSSFLYYFDAVIFSYLAFNCASVSGLLGSIKMQSTGHTC